MLRFKKINRLADNQLCKTINYFENF